MDSRHITGCLFGMALGDALGSATEFLDLPAIRNRFPPRGPQEPTGNPARVTDDTQMALAVGEALIAASQPYTPDTLTQQLIKSFIEWNNSPDNDRSPGMTCITSCERLEAGEKWQDATNISSKGCGANMRVQPVGLLNVNEATRAGIAQLQAAITHGHPTGLVAADLTAFVIDDLAHGGTPFDLPQRVRRYANYQYDVYHGDWLDDLWRRAFMMPTARHYITHGWDECVTVLGKLDQALIVFDREADPCQATGQGWIAEEAFGTALLCFMLYPDDPIAVIQRAAATSGDSDSIACIAGAFAGAYHGVDAWPADWLERIEYRDRIQSLSEAIARQNQQQSIDLP